MSKRAEVPEEERIYIREVAEALDRRIGTLRKWEAEKTLPKHLMPRRGTRGWRYWTAAQVEELKEWVANRPPSSGLPHLAHRDPEQAAQQVRAMRKPRKKTQNDRSTA